MTARFHSTRAANALLLAAAILLLAVRYTPASGGGLSTGRLSAVSAVHDTIGPDQAPVAVHFIEGPAQAMPRVVERPTGELDASRENGMAASHSDDRLDTCAHADARIRGLSTWSAHAPLYKLYAVYRL